MLQISPELLARLHKPAPRYTSYPTAVDWGPLPPLEYEKRLGQAEGPLSLYIHIPFCKSMCLYCGCSVVLNRKSENEERYVEMLLKEIDLVADRLGTKREVVQLHFGGGTPTKLTGDLLTKIMQKLESRFALAYSQEIAMEVDPRTVYEDQGAKLKLLKALGFNRISFGVQDTNERVQEAVKRRQSLEMTKATFLLAQELGFDKINIDLIYGLPYQTKATFQKTIEDILELRPDRIALFSYAKVPWLKKHQRAIKEETLPSFEEKFAIYAHAREALTKGGYIAIGMDHFALEKDELALAYKEKRLTRNFQGYSVNPAKQMIGLGVTAIGYVQEGYFQNLKTIQEYSASLAKGTLPVHRGRILSEEDLHRKKMIHNLMCHFELKKTEKNRPYFSTITKELLELEKEELLRNEIDKIIITPLGELFIRNIAMLFDGYTKQREPNKTFSKSI